MQSWPYPSSSGPGTYTVLLQDNGLLECDCRGYRIKRPDKPRQCRHVEDVIKKNGLNIVQRGDLLYATDGAAQMALPVEEVDHAKVYADAHANGYINPMLASAITDRKKDDSWEKVILPYQDGLWAGEIKYDGVRVISAVGKLGTRFWSRPRPGEGEIGLVRRMPQHIELAMTRLLPTATYDGELIVGGAEASKSYSVSRLDKEADKVLALFDILTFEGQSLMDKPYAVRRKLLETACPYEGQCIQLAQSVPVSAEQVRNLWSAGAEGVILKRLDSIYRPGWRSPDWKKIKLEFYTVGTVTGYMAAKNGPYSKVCLRTDEGVETTVKTKDNHWYKEFAAHPDKYIGWRLVFKHYGPTPDGKFRGPIIWDHWAGEGE